VALVFGLLGLALAWNVVSERGDLRELRKDLKDEVRASLGQLSDEPEIVLLTADNRPLDGAAVNAVIGGDPVQLVMPIIIRNQGKAWTGSNVAIKVYTPAALPLLLRSTDEPNFAFEVYWLGSAETGLTSLPAGFAYSFNLTLYPDPSKKIRAGRYSCLVKFYYGRGKVARASISLGVTSGK
jgi:hypothetical protein